jgi:UDP-4-amino-4,6-dideoxy-N-acetyl-beta-L-altrosamine transaminase
VIPYGRQSISDEDVQEVVNVLQSDFLTQGPMVPRFEDAVASYCGVKYAVAVNSGTSALHMACRALGVETGDIVWTSPITFVASANCARYCGATVDLVDIDPVSYNMSVDALKMKLESADSAGSLPKVLIPVHLAGHPCDMRAIGELAEEYGFSVIEDASHALGGRYRDDKIGCCRYSDITVFSFHPVKVITTAEGGMAVTNDEQLARRMALLRTHGITRDATEMDSPSDGPWYYEQIDLGFNYRMTDIEAALGISQLRRLDEFVARRHELAARYDRLLRDLPVMTPWRNPADYSGFHLYIVRLDLQAVEASHRVVFERLRSNGIGVNLHYIPVYRHPYYSRSGLNPDDYPEAERYYAEAISIPLFPSLTEQQQDAVVEALEEAI